jgi:cytosine permease
MEGRVRRLAWPVIGENLLQTALGIVDTWLVARLGTAAIAGVGGFLASAMFLLFAIASIPPACFCSFVLGNSLATMIPSVPRIVSTMAGVTVALVLAVTGVAANLVGLFTSSATLPPHLRAMTADYLLAGRR